MVLVTKIVKYLKIPQQTISNESKLPKFGKNNSDSDTKMDNLGSTINKGFVSVPQDT